MGDVQLDEAIGPAAKGKGRWSALAKAGEIEGWLAGVLVLACFLLPSVDHPSNLEVIWRAILVALTYGCALGGAHFGRTGGRVSGWCVLVVLSVILFLCVFRGIWQWQDVRSYWGF